MTDRELLELAARAAQIDFYWMTGDGWERTTNKFSDNRWNPLTDDGDAFRLAVKIGIEYRIITTAHNAGVQAYDGKIQAVFEVYDSDPYAATRRAIVRAAAEIGKEMK